MNEFRQQCIEELSEALDHPLLFERSPADRREIARTVATKLFMLGWTPPSVPEVKEEWRVIPGFQYFEASNKGFIRHALSRVWVPITVSPVAPDYATNVTEVVLHDDHGRDIRLELQQVLDTTWPREGTDILFDNGSTAHIPDAEFTGKVTEVEVREEEWRDIECIAGLENFEVERGGSIRNKKTKWVREPEYDIDRNVFATHFVINGKPINIVGEWLADAMWDDNK